MQVDVIHVCSSSCNDKSYTGATCFSLDKVGYLYKSTKPVSKSNFIWLQTFGYTSRKRYLKLQTGSIKRSQKGECITGHE